MEVDDDERSYWEEWQFERSLLGRFMIAAHETIVACIVEAASALYSRTGNEDAAIVVHYKGSRLLRAMRTHPSRRERAKACAHSMFTGRYHPVTGEPIAGLKCDGGIVP